MNGDATSRTEQTRISFPHQPRHLLNPSISKMHEIEYITDAEKVMAYGVMSMKAIVVIVKAVSMGKVLEGRRVRSAAAGSVTVPAYKEQQRYKEGIDRIPQKPL